MYEGWSSLQAQQVKNLMVHCCGAGSLSDPGISMCCRCGPKKKRTYEDLFWLSQEGMLLAVSGRGQEC